MFFQGPWSVNLYVTLKALKPDSAQESRSSGAQCTGYTGHLSELNVLMVSVEVDAHSANHHCIFTSCRVVTAHAT